MSGIKQQSRRKLSGVLMVLIVIGCFIPGEVGSLRDRSEVANMMKNRKTVCVGRYLIDVPDRAEVRYSSELIDGFEIDTFEETDAEFRDRTAARETDIDAKAATAGPNGPGGMVEAHDLRIPGMVGRTYIYGRDRGYLIEGGRRVAMESVSVETHAHIGDLSFTLSATSVDVDAAKAAEAMLARLRPRRENEIPTVAGFCVWRAVFADPLPSHQSEHVVMFLALPDHPDMSMALASITGRSVEPGLLARVADTDSRASMLESILVRKVRAHKRSINGIAGEEEVERVHELNFTTGYSFNWETRGVPGNVFQPELSFELQAGNSLRPGGKPVESSLHENALLELWDGMSSSIRMRKPSTWRGTVLVPSGQQAIANNVQNRP